MNVELSVVKGAKPTKITLRSSVTVGRAKNNEIRVTNPEVSRHHCRIFEKDGQLMVRDMGSWHGTYINGKIIRTDVTLFDGDYIEIGKVVLQAVGGDLPKRDCPSRASDADLQYADYQAAVCC